VKLILVIFAALVSFKCLADENSEIFNSFRRQYCKENIVLTEDLMKACLGAESFSELRTRTAEAFKKCLAKGNGSAQRVSECTQFGATLETASKAFFAGAKSINCNKSSGEGNTPKSPEAVK
jgi:hypothetical protein